MKKSGVHDQQPDQHSSGVNITKYIIYESMIKKNHDGIMYIIYNHYISQSQ